MYRKCSRFSYVPVGGCFVPGARASRPLRGFFCGRDARALYGDEGDHMNKVITMRERLPFRPSPEPTPDPTLVREGRFQAPTPDKGRVGEGIAGVEWGIRGAQRRARGTGRLSKGGPAGQGVFGGKSGFCVISRRQPPLIPPLSGGKWVGDRDRSHHRVLRDYPEEREPQGRTGLALFLHGLKAGKAHLQTQINPAKSRVLLFDEH
jgi:hypothetical protein